MESMGSKKKSRPRRSFTAEFKAEIVEVCQRGDRSVAQVARDFDLTETAVREWVKQAERDAGTRDDGGLTTAERDELRGTTPGEPSAARGRRHSETGHSFLREGDPVNVYPFIEAEKADSSATSPGRASCCRSTRSPPTNNATEALRARDALRCRADRADPPGHPCRIERSLRGPTHPRDPAPPRPPGRPQAGRPADASRRAARQDTETVAQDHGARPGRDRAPGDLVRRDFAVDAATINTRWCGDITYSQHLAGLAVPGHRPRPPLPPGRRLRHGRPSPAPT